ncbi:MAG: PIN domain-containing protein [Lachnospiraceae bacterium]|nr:PIN domain-containing protein [Lachnospiraceae bacterium]
MRLVIDTNIWIKALVSKEYEIDCAEALYCFLHDKDMELALDCKGEIMAEYRDNLQKERSFQKCMIKLENEKRKCLVSSNLNKAHKNALISRGFHEPEDHVFVGTAMNADKLIVTEDSDYGVHQEAEKQAVFTYMKEKMGMQVMSAEQFSREQA